MGYVIDYTGSGLDPTVAAAGNPSVKNGVTYNTSTPVGGAKTAAPAPAAPATPPSTAVTPNAPASANPSAINTGQPGASAGTDVGTENAESDLTPRSFDEIAAYFAGSSASTISAISDQASSAEAEANLKATNASKAADFYSNARGDAGSSEATADAAAVETQRGNDIADAQAAKEAAVASVQQWAATNTESAYENEKTTAQNYIDTKTKGAQNAIVGLASSGVTLSSLSQSNPNEYNSLLQAFGGDPNALTAAWIASTSPQQVGQPAQAGSYLVYTYMDPVTKQMTTHAVDTGVSLTADDKATNVPGVGVVVTNTRTGDSHLVGGTADPTYRALKGQQLESSYARTANSILKSSGLLSGAAGSGANGSIPSKYYNAATIMDRINAATKSGSNAVSDEDIIDALVSINTGGGKPSQAQFDQIVTSLGTADKSGVLYNKYINNSSSFLPADVRQDAINLATNNFDALKTAKEQWDKTATDILSKNGLTPDKFDISTNDTYLNPPADATNSTAAIPASAVSAITNAGFSDNGDGTYSYNNVSYSYDPSTGLLNGDDGSQIDPTQ